MIYLGLDISLNRTGWFVFSDDGMKVLGYGAVEIPLRMKDEYDKVFILYQEFDKIIKKYHPDACGIEAEFVSLNKKVALRLGHCHGAAIIALKQYNIPFTYYPVMTLKTQTVEDLEVKKEDGTRKTSAELKQEVQDTIIEIFGKEQFTKEYKTDETDAASAAYTYYKLGGVQIEKIKKKQKIKKKKNKEKEIINRRVKQATLKHQEKLDNKFKMRKEQLTEKLKEKSEEKIEKKVAKIKENKKEAILNARQEARVPQQSQLPLEDLLNKI